MNLRSALSQHHRLLGWWLAVLALCALNLEGLQHYQPRMLAEGSICYTASPAGNASPDGAPASQRADCGLCCAQAQTPVVPVVAALSPRGPFGHERALPALPQAPVGSPGWAPGRPRGPPLVV